MKSPSAKMNNPAGGKVGGKKTANALKEEVQRLRDENVRYARYIREKTNQLLEVMGTLPLRPEEFDDRELLTLDPIGIIAGSFEQVFEYLNETISDLSQARDELQAIFDATGVGISIIDQDFTIVKCNEKQRELLVDKQLDNVCGSYCYEVYCLKNGPGLDCPAVDTFATGRPVVVSEVRKKDKYFQLVTTPYAKDANGQVTRVIEVALDITARKKAEEEEQRQRGYYLAEKSKLASVLQSLSEGLLVTDSRNRIISVNGAALQILDLSQKQVQELRINELFAECPAEAMTIFDVDTPQACQNVEIPHRYQDRELLLSVNSVPLFDGDNNLIGRVFTFRDITEEKHRQEVLHRTEKLAAVGQLSAGIAHELNTPLGSILGYARLLLKNNQLSTQQKDRLHVIAEQAKKSSEIIQGLLKFARTTEPTGQPVSVCDATAVIGETLKILTAEFESRGIEIRTDFIPDADATIDEKKLEQILLNILLNSIQALQKGGSILVTTQTSGNRLQLTITDTGPGIPPEILPRIFDPFFTTKEVGEGTGLGLSICSGIINEYDGSIDVFSEPGKGASFTITLPMEQTE
ncbi:MAG: ATP-binding protein [Desulfobulbaceae bacterium]|nr:ATP-binding protein [Desulfobulbaceae bacterium]